MVCISWAYNTQDVVTRAKGSYLAVYTGDVEHKLKAQYLPVVKTEVLNINLCFLHHKGAVLMLEEHGPRPCMNLGYLIV